MNTLPTFAQLHTPRQIMARYHIHIPDSLMDQLEAASVALKVPKSKFISRGIMMALDDARLTFGEAANEPRSGPLALAAGPVEASVPAEAPAAPTALPFRPVIVQGMLAISNEIDRIERDEVASIKRGDTVWFDMAGVCRALEIEVEWLLSEIDGEDDILQYAGRDWIDAPGVQEAMALCRDQGVSDKFWDFVQTKVN